MYTMSGLTRTRLALVIREVRFSKYNTARDEFIPSKITSHRYGTGAEQTSKYGSHAHLFRLPSQTQLIRDSSFLCEVSQDGRKPVFQARHTRFTTR